MVRIKVIRLSQILYIGLVLALAAIALTLVLTAVPSSTSEASPGYSAPTATPVVAPTPSPARVVVPKRSQEDAPVDEAYWPPALTMTDTPAETASPLFLQDEVSKPSAQGTLSAVSRFLFGVDFSDPMALAISAVPYAQAMPASTPTPTQDAVIEREIESELDDAVPEEIHIEIARIEDDYAPAARVAQTLRALVYHTHTEESYAQNEKDLYVEAGKWRTQDYEHSIVRVGDELSRQMSMRGIDVLHDKTDHEPPKLGTAYVRSLETLEGYEEREEEFDLYIDLHRDAYSKNWDTPSPTVIIDGKECARVMLLVGNGEGFTIKPDWTENYKFAQKLTDELNAIAPGFARPVMVKNGRYNQHISKQSILIEVGHNESQLQQCLNSMPYVADALARVLSPEQ